MQNDWRLEIGDRMEEIRVKEYVSIEYIIVDSKKTSLPAPFALITTNDYHPCWLPLKLLAVLQELHNLEVNLVETQREQRLQEQRLQQREAELAERELTLLQRELHVMMAQQQPSQSIPTPKKRKGKFKKKMLLKKESSSSSMISGPSGLCLTAPLMTQI